MSLSLRDLKELRAVNNALLDPLSHDTPEAWLLDVCARLQTLCHASAGLIGYSFPNSEPRFISREVPAKYVSRVAELALNEHGTIRTGDPRVEKVMDDLRRRVDGVSVTADLLKNDPYRVDDLRESPIFRDVAFPLGLPGSTSLFHSGASGEFMVQVSYPEFDRKPLGEGTEQVLAVLLPSFAASVGALARLGASHRAMGLLLDVLEDGAVVFDAPAGRILMRNAAIERFAAADTDPMRLELAIRRAAGSAAWETSAASIKEEHKAALSTGWCSRSGVHYRLRAVRLPSGSLTKQEAVLVLIQRLGPSVPPERDLIRWFGLTRREAQVAHLLAFGRSDREIAAKLRLSAHTVRHHAEAVFIKTGVTTRKALALHLAAPKDSET